MSHGVKVLAIAIVLSVSIAGCAGLSDLGEMRTQAVQKREEVARNLHDLSAYEQSLPQNDPARTDIAAQQRELEALDAVLSAAIQRIDAVADEARNPTDPISQTMAWLAPWMPGHVRMPVVLGSALLVSLLRGRRLRESFRSVVQGIDQAMKDDGEFSQAFKRNANTFRATQTPLAQRLVEKMGKKAR